MAGIQNNLEEMVTRCPSTKIAEANFNRQKHGCFSYKLQKEVSNIFSSGTNGHS